MAVLKAGSAPLGDLAACLAPFGALVRRSESRHAMERYVTGLVADVPRKTAADIGRVVAGTNAQRLQEFLTRTTWDPQEMDRLRIAHMLRQASAGPGILILDDTGLPKKGEHSVGVARQYSGTLGRVESCQVLVTAHYVDQVFDWPVSARLYLPESWTEEPERLRRAQVPEGMRFQSKGEIALGLVDLATGAGLRPRAAVADAGYGDQPAFLNGLEDRKLPYVVGLKSDVRFRRADLVDGDPGDGPPPPYQGMGRPRKAKTLKDRIAAEAAAQILAALPEAAWQTIAWREGTKGALVKQFARVRVYRSGLRGQHRPSAGWLLGERPLPGHTGERRYYFAARGLDELPLTELVALAHQRWVVERFYQDAKGELGLDDYEGRLWPGLHRHVALVMLAHSYLTLRQSYGAEVTPAAREPASEPSGGERPRRSFPPSRTTKPRRAPPRSHRGAVPPSHRAPDPRTRKSVDRI